MKYFILTVLLVAIPSMGYSQTNESRSYSKAKVYLKNHNVFMVKHLKVNSTEASFLNSANKKKGNLSMEEVNFIKAKKGSYLWDGAIYGSLSMALSAVLINADKDPLTRPKKFGTAEYIGFTLIGAGLGAFIGSLFPKWGDVYSEGKFIGLNLPHKIDFDASHDLAVIRITIPL